MQVTNGEALLTKYNLKPNDAVLAEGIQSEMYLPFYLLPLKKRREKKKKTDGEGETC